jgi:hypothetical protein
MGPLLYDVNSWWPSKVETAEAVGVRFLRTLDSFGRIEASFKDWESSDEIDGSRGYQIEPLRARIGAWISAHPPKTVDPAEWIPGTGYWVYAVSGGEPESGPSRQAAFHVEAGSKFRNDNHFEVGSPLRPPDIAFVTYPLYRAALLTMISIWPAPWACARCSIWGKDPPTPVGEPAFPYSGFQMPWIAYLNADRAAGVNVPTAVATERTPDGGLLMIATKARLDPTNVEHMRASRLIAQIMMERASEPL